MAMTWPVQSGRNRMSGEQTRPRGSRDERRRQPAHVLLLGALLAVALVWVLRGPYTEKEKEAATGEE
jgi:hypothetical protein